MNPVSEVIVLSVRPVMTLKVSGTVLSPRGSSWFFGWRESTSRSPPSTWGGESTFSQELILSLGCVCRRHSTHGMQTDFMVMRLDNSKNNIKQSSNRVKTRQVSRWDNRLDSYGLFWTNMSDGKLIRQPTEFINTICWPLLSFLKLSLPFSFTTGWGGGGGGGGTPTYSDKHLKTGIVFYFVGFCGVLLNSKCFTCCT